MRQFLEVLLDSVSILPKVRSVRIERRREQSVDTLTVELADYSLYSQFNFGVVPTSERIHVGTAAGDPKTDGATAGTGVLTSASSNFTTQGVTVNDLILVLSSSVGADVSTWAITAVGVTTVTSSHIFGAASGINFIILKNQGKFFVEKPDVIENKNQVGIPSLWGRSGLARMLDPFAGKLTRSYSVTTTFYAVVKELVTLCGMDSTQVQFDIDDYAIPPNIYSVSNQFPLQVVIDLASKTNGYVRSKKDGNLWIRKDLYHFDALPIAQALTDNEIPECRQTTEYPQFGNRILVHSSISSGGLNVRIRLRLETSCIRGDGRASTLGEAVVTDGAGNPVADGTAVDWSIANSALAEWLPTTTLTRSRGISGELQSASDLLEVTTDLPIREVLGVYLENDSNRATNFFLGGSFLGSTITLGSELPFTDSRVVIDYVAGGLATSTLQSLAGAAQTETTVHASIGKVRDSQTFCINNNRNVSISIRASKTEFNLCLGEQSAVSEIIGQVKIDGEPGQGAMVSWTRTGDAGGTLTPRFSAVQNQSITERTTSQNNFTVSVANEISSVVSVTLDSSGNSGQNYYSAAQNRKPSFSGTEITLGTNLPDARMAVIVVYVATAIVKAQYTNPTKIGEDTITATLADRTSTPESASVDIAAINSCTGGPNQPPPAEPGGNNCKNSVASAQNCDAKTYPNLFDSDKTECICRLETGSACPQTEEECKKMCEGLVNKYGLNPLGCDKVPTREEVRKVEQATGKIYLPNQAPAAVACSAECNGDPECINTCVAAYALTATDRCTKQCVDHGVQISPKSGSIACSGAKKITFSASGGTPPYFWTATIGNIVTSGDNGENAALTPPANPGSGVAGDAYARLAILMTNSPPTCGASANCARFDCNDQRLTPNSEIQACCSGFGLSCDPSPCSCTATCAGQNFTVSVSGENIVGPATDKRNQGMIDAGCNPCGLHFSSGGVVTVKDSKGKSASAVVTA